MPLSIGVNLRVTGHCNQGGRKYMEDMFSVAYQQSSNDRELEYAFFGIFDGHGGGEAATFAKENLMDIIVKQKNFWSDNDEDVLKAIRDGYVNTHYAMWRELEKWPRTASGLPSTAGTTASIAFIRKGKIYIGHVGDSGIILGYQEKGDTLWKSKALTRDHKPECGAEMTRIQESGGKVVSKSGVPRVVWNRPRLGHKGPVRRSTHIDEIPFLAVARSLGDLWSYNSELNTFVVSPEPDVKVVKIDVKSHRCLIFGTDGLWNMLTPQAAVSIVQAAERHNEKHLIASQQTGNGQGDVQMWINPSKSLVDRALGRWSSTRLRADNTSVVTLMLDPPGPTHVEILLSQKREQMASTSSPVQSPPETPEANVLPSESIHCPDQSPIHKPHPSPPEVISHYYPATPITPKPPCYSDIQKHPDSSNHSMQDTSNLLNSESSNSSATFESKEDITPDQSFMDLDVSPEEESIQVAEISSSNVSDENGVSNVNISVEDSDNNLIDIDVTMVESSLSEDTSKEEYAELSTEEDISLSDTKFILERKNWLQEVPEAEKFLEEPTENIDLQRIRFTEPQGPRLRRSVHDNTNSNSLPKRLSTSTGNYSNVVIRQTSRRRHSTGAPPNNQRQQQKQRRSLTPKSASSSPNYIASANKLKRSAKVLIAECGFEEPRVGVGTRNTPECRYEAKDRANTDTGDNCLKRRTRSEDLRNLQDENDPSNQKKLSRHRWPGTETSISRTNGVLNTSTSGMQERRLSSPNSFKRRNLEKKVTPVKTIRRPSINRTASRLQMRDSFWDQGRASCTGTSCSSSRRQTVVGLINSIAESITTTSSSTPKRWLRSDTVAATPIKTLRSRNVDIAGQTVPAQVAQQYATVKPNRILEPQIKLKQATVTSDLLITSPTNQQTQVVSKVKSTSCIPTQTSMTTPHRAKQSCNVTPVVGSNSTSCVSSGPSNTSSGSISKRAKTPYNPSARSLSTRSRIKRFSK